MNALNLDLKLSQSLIQIIGRIERLSGTWDNSREDNQKKLGQRKREESLEKNVLASLCLDNTTPAPLSHPILAYFNSKSPFDLPQNTILSGECLENLHSCKRAFEAPFELTNDGILKLYKLVNTSQPQQDIFQESALTRINPCAFLSNENQRVFETVAPFLISRRFKELLEWTNDAFYNCSTHPLLITGTFHLLFLQLHPFKTANHRLALIINWHLLSERGYDWVNYCSPWTKFLDEADLYFNTLKYAEKSAYGDWSTVNVWLEFYLKTILECANETIGRLGVDQRNEAILSATQLKILETIKNHGSLNRERLVSETGIAASTLKYNLGLLAERGHLIREGGGRSTYYRIS